VPYAVEPYVALATAALDLAERAGRLEPGLRESVEEGLAPWR